MSNAFEQWTFFLLGMLVMMLSYNFLKFTQLRDRIYLYYACYITAMAFYFGKGLLVLDKVHYDFYGLVFSMIAYIFYFEFAQLFVNVAQRAPFTSKLLRSMSFVLFFYVLIEIVLYNIGTQKALEHRLHFIIRIAIIILSLYNLGVLWSKRDTLVIFFFAGSFSLLTGSCVAFYKSIYVDPTIDPNSIFIDSLFYMGAGLVVELLCFSLGLSYKSKLIELEKDKAQEDLLSQLQENQRLQNSMNDELKRQVEIASTEIISKNQLLEKQKEEKLTSEYEEKLANMKLLALRAQMNPHFIFNCMNTIEAFIVTNKKDEASDFIQKFSKLIRAVLENSMHEMIPIFQDLDALNYYLHLEVIRANYRFKYKIICDDNLANNYLIPPLLLQPFVENAVLHGVRHIKEKDGVIGIHLYQDEKKLICIVQDNGIGRRKSKTLENETTFKREKQALGINFTQERITALNELGTKDYYVHTVDIDSEEETGTKVILHLPLVKE